MNIEFVKKSPAREVEVEENLVVNGDVIGFIRTNKETKERGSRYHAGFDFGPGSCMLIQGHGGSKEEAIIKAIESGKNNAARLLAAISELENKLGGITA